MKRLRIAFLIHSLESGGAETQLVEWLRGLPSSHFDCRVYCLVRGGFHEATVREMGIPIDILGYRPMRGPNGSLDARAALTAVPAFARLRALLRRDRPHILQTVLLMSDVFGACAAALHPAPMRLAGSSRSLSQNARLGPIRTAVLRRAIHRANLVMCNSRIGAQDLQSAFGLEAARTRVIYNGVDCNKFEEARARREAVRDQLEIPPDTPFIGCIAQFRPEKQHEILLEAFRQLAQQFPRPVLALAGGGPLKAQIEQTARNQRLGDRVRFLGVWKDVPGLMAALDMLVLQSRVEGLPNVLLEAMAAGVPIVATQVGGIPEVLNDGVCGLLVSPGDPQALAGGMRHLLDKPAMALAMAQRARRRAREVFSLEALHRNIRAFYLELARQPQPPSPNR